MRRTLLALVLFGIPGVAGATTARHASLAELVRESTVVALGTTEARESFWDGGRIYTRTHVHIVEVWAGSELETHTVEVLTLGGVVDDLGQRVAGAARLPLNRRVVLFLSANGSGAFRPVGMAQGVTYVTDNGDSDPPIVRHIGGLRMVGEAPSEPFPASLSLLRRAVQELSRAR